jgi:purine nucleosidase
MRVHLDTDFGGDTDDACALAYLLGCPDVELTGVTTVADADGMRAAYARHLLALAGRADVPVAAGAAVSLSTGERAAPEYGDWPACPAGADRPGAALDLLDRSLDAGATVFGIGPFTTLALYQLVRPGRLRQPVLMAGWVDPPAPGLPDWGPDLDFNVQWDRRAFALVLDTAPLLVTLPATLTSWARDRDLPRLRTAGAVGALLAGQLVSHAVRHDMAALADAYPGLPPDLLNFQYDPAACAAGLGRAGATVEDVTLTQRPDGALVRDPAGTPARVVTALDGAAFAEHWLATIEAI